MIPEHRKKKLSEFAHHLATRFSAGTITSLDKTADYEDIGVYYDQYQDAFDGMLVHDDNTFHIHINKDRGNTANSKRSRFTLAHELGHYFIDEHRLGLKYGKLPPHGSIHNLNQKDLIEKEADYFASCLLMPREKFRDIAKGKHFSLDTITRLSEAFQSSILSTVLKFAEIGTHEVTAVISKENKVQWYAQSTDFPKWAFRFRVGQALPPTTVAGEFFTKQDSKYTGIEELSADDWFFVKDSRGNRPLKEQCYFSDSYGYVISLLWF